MSVPDLYFDNTWFPPLFQSDNIIFLTRFDHTSTYFPIFMSTYLVFHQSVWIFEMHIKCTYKLHLQRLMDWKSIPQHTKKDPVLWDPFILHTTNADIRMLHGYRVLAPVWKQSRYDQNPFQSIQDADIILSIEVYTL